MRRLNALEYRPDGRYVLYWMQASERTRQNPALEHAVALADEVDKPLVVCFGLMDGYPEANERHYLFMLQGLRDVSVSLERRGVTFVCRHADPPDAALHFGRHAAAIVCDRGYLRHQKAWREKVGREASCRVDEVESDVVVPVELASDKREHAAVTIRRKIHKHRDGFLKPLPERTPKRPSLRLDLPGADIDVRDPQAAADALKIDRSVGRSDFFTGGEVEAARRLSDFLGGKLHGYDAERNEPSSGYHSYLGAYLHFGQISPVAVALAVRDADAPQADREAYLEELVVRRELTMNFVHFSPDDYDCYDTLPAWARKTLDDHRPDPRPHVYSRQQLEAADTFDPYWNAAQREMNVTGFMPNYLRMYWGKKILEWSATPEEGYANTLYLNNKYFLCGRDPNAFSNVAWVFGLHDRAWQERPIFGKVRYMNAAGLDRKFDMKAYLRRVDAMTG